MKKFLLIIISLVMLSAYKVETKKWSKSDTFYGFLKKYSIPISVYYDLPGNIKRKVKRIKIGETIFLLTENNTLKQALIPIDDKNQLQIIHKNNKFLTKIVPIIYETQKKYIEVTINNNLNYDLYKATNLRILSNKIINIFSDKVNFRYIPKNTKIKILYEEKKRYGSVKQIKVLYAEVFNKFYQYSAFLNPYDERYYDEKARSLKGMFLPAPLRYKRISSKFGMRFHPILHKWKMHDGIDYVNRIGTPIKSVADGKIIFKGWIKGYGRVVKIKHRDGYITLYGHLKGWPKNIYIGKWVKQGQIIGYLGNSGLSTGPHLHFGVMKYGKWINPLKIKKSAKITLWGKQRKNFFAYISTLKKDYSLVLK